MAGMDDLCYCDECGSTDIESADIETWERMYQVRYSKNQHKIYKNG